MKVNESGFLIAKIHITSGRIFERYLKRYSLGEINPAQGRILFVLWQYGKMPFGQLAQKCGLGKSTLTSMLGRMETSGLIERTASEDKRTVIIGRTQKVIELEEKYAAVSAEMNTAVFKGIPESEQAELERLLKKVLDNCERIIHTPNK